MHWSKEKDIKMFRDVIAVAVSSTKVEIVNKKMHGSMFLVPLMLLKLVW